MSSFSTPAGRGSRHVATIEWTDQHQGMTAVAAIAVAVLAGALLGILLSVASAGTGSAMLHRAGGHALGTVTQAQHAALAAVTTVTGGEAATAHDAGIRSPARGGFAVGRAEGAGSGFIAMHSGTRAPFRGGFADRSLGAGRDRR
jgi:hypothetical protein